MARRLILFPLLCLLFAVSPCCAQTNIIGVDYNAVVAADSIVLLSEQPEEALADCPIDTFAVYGGEHIVVSDIRVILSDPVDSVWLEVADEKARFGWIHQDELLAGAVPADPISQVIHFFYSPWTLLGAIGLFLLCLLPSLCVKGVPIIHLRDIHSFYPTSLCILVALAAVLYSSIQLFCRDEWLHFYFYPTLNPFDHPLLICFFLCALWAIVVDVIAVFDDVLRTLPFPTAMAYLSSVIAVCVGVSLVIIFTTPFFVGYIFFVAYLFFALWRYY